ncbi:MAG: MgtC/SapB family protein [Bacteroidales bacterium]|nr:MgtC/SapB family protein [Bacteroidales bacterium]MBR4351957.1 MgtC/SapB family protein [Bacteroidales bacterium]
MDLSPTLDFVIRLLVASLVGAVIGFERKYRAKGAGIGTHVLVAIGAALFMIVSQHGFDGAPRFDAARVAAGVVSGIGFLGGGIILKQQNRVSGLTTAAGLWVTAAMGLAVGSGMYILGAASVLIVLLWADITHLLTRKVGKRQVTISLTSNDKTALKDALQSLGKGVETFSLSKHDAIYKVLAVLNVRNKEYNQLIEKLSSFPEVELESLE